MAAPEDDHQQAAGSTAEEAEREAFLARVRRVARATDTNPSLLRVARRARRRLPGDEQYGDRLSTAGGAAVDTIARGVSVLQPDRPSVVHELGLSALQLWQSVSEATGRGRGDQELAILFTDLVGFSTWALKAGDAAAVQLLREVGEAVEGAVLDRRGRIVKRLGDGAMVTFLRPFDAVTAALDAQTALAEVEVEGFRPRLRAGCHWGRPRSIGGDLLGVDVNIAARVGEAAKGGQVLVSESTAELLDAELVVLGRAKRLRAAGTPPGFRVREVSLRAS